MDDSFERPRPSVSVITPTTSLHALLGRTVRSVVQQTYFDFEHIIIVDGDDRLPDPTEVSDPRLVYLRNPGPRGPAAARNRGLERAQGSIVCFLDSDDLWPTNYLETVVDFLAERPEITAAISLGLSFDDQHRVLRITAPAACAAATTRFDIVANLIGCPSGVSFRVSESSRPIRFDERMWYFEDHFFYMSLLANGARFGISGAHYYYRTSPTQLTAKPNAAKVAVSLAAFEDGLSSSPLPGCEKRLAMRRAVAMGERLGHGGSLRHLASIVASPRMVERQLRRRVAWGRIDKSRHQRLLNEIDRD